MVISLRKIGGSIVTVLVLACNNSEPKETTVARVETTAAVQSSEAMDSVEPVIPAPQKSIPVLPPSADARPDTLLQDTVKVDTIPPVIDSLPIRKVGELILNEKIIATDNPVTFKLMDSLNASTRKERQFYFKVFDKMMSRADGSLSEAIGSHARKFVERRTREFFDFTTAYDKTQMETWASQLGIEIFLASDNTDREYKKTADLLKTNCTLCDTRTIQRLNEFIAMMQRTIKENEIKK